MWKKIYNYKEVINLNKDIKFRYKERQHLWTNKIELDGLLDVFLDRSLIEKKTNEFV